MKEHWTFEGERIPGEFIPDTTQPDLQRFVATDYGWQKLRRLKCEKAEGRCSCGCGRFTPLSAGQLHHTGRHGRGMGGSWRDDRFTVWLSIPCHDREEQKRQGTKFGAKGKADARS